MQNAIGIENAGFTSLGTALAKTEIGGADFVLPVWVQNILAIIPQTIIDVQTVAESVLTKATVESDDNILQPYEILSPPIGAALGATATTFVGRNEKYLMGAPVIGGSKLRFYETPLVANTAAPTGSISMILTNGIAGFAQRRSKLGTLTTTGTTASVDVAGTPYQINGGKRIVELIAVMGHATVAAASAVIAYMKYTSSDYDIPVPLKLPMNPIGSGLTTLIPTLIDGVSRQPVEVPLKAVTQATIADYLFMGLAPTVAGNFISGVMYE